jgi:large subunit ribosomal protein L4
VRRPASEVLDPAKPRRTYGGFERNPRVLLVLFRTEQAVWKSLRNLGDRVQILLPEELNTYDVLLNDWLVFSKASLDATVARLDESGASVEADTDDVDESEDAAAEAS